MIAEGTVDQCCLAFVFLVNMLDFSIKFLWWRLPGMLPLCSVTHQHKQFYNYKSVSISMTQWTIIVVYWQNRKHSILKLIPHTRFLYKYKYDGINSFLTRLSTTKFICILSLNNFLVQSFNFFPLNLILILILFSTLITDAIQSR